MLREALASADIIIGWSRPWDIHVHDERLYRRILVHGTLGLGEAYMEGWWDCESIDEMCFRSLRGYLYKHLARNFRVILAAVNSVVINLQSRNRAGHVGKQHYDLGNDFFEAMLDPAMQYSCAYFQNTVDLVEAQRLKMELICRKLALHPGMRLLDIGCGWGGLAKYAARQYGCAVIGVTISKEQQRYAENSCRGLPIEIRLQDYRDISEPFDRVVSVGMMEHVGYKNYRHYMEIAGRCLKTEGLFLCHTIGASRSSIHADPWITKYIFPNSILPSASQVARTAEGIFILEDVHNFGAHYDFTLLAWEDRFRRSWKLFQSRYGERFYRMWRFYLLSCAGAFRARRIQLFQFIFSKGGLPGGYSSIR